MKPHNKISMGLLQWAWRPDPVSAFVCVQLRLSACSLRSAGLAKRDIASPFLNFVIRCVLQIEFGILPLMYLLFYDYIIWHKYFLSDFIMGKNFHNEGSGTKYFITVVTTLEVHKTVVHWRHDMMILAVLHNNQ